MKGQFLFDLFPTASILWLAFFIQNHQVAFFADSAMILILPTFISDNPVMYGKSLLLSG